MATATVEVLRRYQINSRVEPTLLVAIDKGNARTAIAGADPAAMASEVQLLKDKFNIEQAGDPFVGIPNGTTIYGHVVVKARTKAISATFDPTLGQIRKLGIDAPPSAVWYSEAWAEFMHGENVWLEYKRSPQHDLVREFQNSSYNENKKTNAWKYLVEDYAQLVQNALQFDSQRAFLTCMLDVQPADTREALLKLDQMLKMEFP